MKRDRFRWWLWAKVCRLCSACPARAHGRIIWRNRDDGWRIDDMCRRDCAVNGSCWCGKLREERPVHIGGSKEVTYGSDMELLQEGQET